MSSSFKDELLLMITEQDSPVIRTDWLTLKLNVKKEKVIITEDEFQPKKKELLDLGKDTYQIEESGYDEVQAFAMAFGILGERKTPKEDFCESTDFNNLESSLPADTIQVATYVNKN